VFPSLFVVLCFILLNNQFTIYNTLQHKIKTDAISDIKLTQLKDHQLNEKMLSLREKDAGTDAGTDAAADTAAAAAASDESDQVGVSDSSTFPIMIPHKVTADWKRVEKKRKRRERESEIDLERGCVYNKMDFKCLPKVVTALVIFPYQSSLSLRHYSHTDLLLSLLSLFAVRYSLG
jgi:secreted Zn-dependent insulinase-like peptidase